MGRTRRPPNLTPWSGNPDQNTPSSAFNLTTYPGGGACPKTLAARPFAPGYTAKSDSTKAGAYSPFQVRIARPDGQQELKVVNVTLPKGLTGKLAGIPYCSEAALAGRGGKQRQSRGGCSQLSGGKPDRAHLDQGRLRLGTVHARPARRSSPALTRARRSRWR